MKIGIVTIVDNANYGNRLQNYALYYILTNKYGCKVTTFATHKEAASNNKSYIVQAKEEVIKILCGIIPSVAEKRFGNDITRWANFTSWNKKIPTRHYYGTEELPNKLNDEFDLFFAGSDQIWNYHFAFRKFHDYFLRFAEDRKKVGISGSFGVEEIPEEWKPVYIEGLSSFSHISVREVAGQKIVKKLTGRDAPVLIDPVLMLSKDEWLKVSKGPRVNCSRPYVLKYYLGDESNENRIDVWAKENGYEIYELLNKNILELYSAGPGEFISLVSHATLVCSDSFHCIAFSIIFSKPFVVYERQGKAHSACS